MGVRVVFLPNCPLILSPLKYKDIWAFFNPKKKKKKKEEPKQEKPLK